MRVFGTDATAVGCFVRFNMALNHEGGALLTLPTSNGKGVALYGGEYLPFVVVGVSTSTGENLSIQKCFESRFYTYAFGSDVESISVTVAAFLTGGKLVAASADRKKAGGGAASSGSFNIMRELYEDGRISKSKSFGSLVLGTGGKVANLMWVGNEGAVFNLGANIYQFTLKFLVMPRPLGKPKS